MKKNRPDTSDIKAGRKTVWLQFKQPKKEPKINNVTKKKKAVENQELINDTFTFCTFRSFHFELRKTLPNLANVDLNFVLRSNNKRKYNKQLELYFELFEYIDAKKFVNRSLKRKDTMLLSKTPRKLPSKLVRKQCGIKRC